MATQIIAVPRKLQHSTPSVRDGLSKEMEVAQRVYGCQLIQKAGILLRLEAVTVASAQTILHRFYFRKSLKKFDVRLVVTASLLLACKLEEDPRRVKNLIDIVYLLSRAEDAGEPITEENIDDFLIDYDSTEFEMARAEAFRCERYILRELGFMVSQTLVHPHRYILQYIHALCKGDYIPTNKLSQIAWGYLNDSMRTTLCCEVQPAVVAVGSIFLAACDMDIPLTKETGWYELFDVSWNDVVKVCTAILSLYKREIPKYVRLVETTSPGKSKSAVVEFRDDRKLEDMEEEDEIVETAPKEPEQDSTVADSKRTYPIDDIPKSEHVPLEAGPQDPAPAPKAVSESVSQPIVEESNAEPLHRKADHSSPRGTHTSISRQHSIHSNDRYKSNRARQNHRDASDSYKGSHNRLEGGERSNSRTIESQSSYRFSESRSFLYERLSYRSYCEEHRVSSFRNRRGIIRDRSPDSPRRGQDPVGELNSSKRRARNDPSPRRADQYSKSSSSRTRRD